MNQSMNETPEVKLSNKVIQIHFLKHVEDITLATGQVALGDIYALIMTYSFDRDVKARQ